MMEMMTPTAEFRLHRAAEYLEEAELLCGEKIGNMHVLANLYHSMMNCLFALFNLKEPGNILHADLVEWFKAGFVQTGIFDRKYADALDFAFHVTHECDCDRMKPPDDNDINQLLPAVRAFVQEVKEYL